LLSNIQLTTSAAALGPEALELFVTALSVPPALKEGRLTNIGVHNHLAAGEKGKRSPTPVRQTTTFARYHWVVITFEVLSLVKRIIFLLNSIKLLANSFFNPQA